MNKKIHDMSPDKPDQLKENNTANNGEAYTMTNEDACSAEFSEGCIIRDNQSE
jgi:hypothetical protein